MKLPKNAQIWLPGYLGSRLHEFEWTRRRKRVQRVWLAFCDHYEPLWSTTDEEKASDRVEKWFRRWPEIAARHHDSAGRPPRYTFFYPEEQYRPGLLDRLASMTHDGISDVEVHIHHDGEGQQDFVDRMGGFTEILHRRHGLLRRHEGRITFGFIHGLWALDNSRPDGIGCGLNNEITLLRDLGCYADFGMPSGASPTQARMVNTIYWAIDDPKKPKSYDMGISVKPGYFGSGDLLMVPGPLGMRWRERLLPRLETGELAAYDLPTPYRVRRWLAFAPRIGEDLFIKLFTHGCQERNYQPLLADGLNRVLELVSAECSKREYSLHFCSAWEMYLAIRKAAGDPIAVSGQEVLSARH